ncbi:MAG: hypothetical protein N3G20_02140 [Verrucomicrobiae bacterium]|nr:hypothetical protein [Verrucomicrobiae bacterium]
MTAFLYLLRCSAIFLVVATVYNYDRLIRQFRAKKPLEWEAVGKPKGFSRPELKDWFLGNFLMQISFAIKSTFLKPAWVRDDEDLHKLWRYYVASYFLCISVGVTLIAIEFSR